MPIAHTPNQPAAGEFWLSAFESSFAHEFRKVPLGTGSIHNDFGIDVRSCGGGD